MSSRLRGILIFPFVFLVGAAACLAQTTTRIEESDPSITYSGNWYSNSSASNSGGHSALTNSTGARVVVTFTGRSINWIGVGDRWNGLATVTVDGQPYKVDSWAATTRYQSVLFTVNGLSQGPHKLSIEINHERGPNGEGSWVWLDAFDIQDGSGVPGGLPAATVGHIENDSPLVTYTGIWYSNINPVHSGGTAVLAVGVGSAVSLNFTGTGIAWLAYRDEWSGLARVILDNELKATIDTYLLPGQARTVPYTVEGLAPGNHSLTIEVTGTHNLRSAGAWVWLDAFDVLQESAIRPLTPVLALSSTYCSGAAWSLAVSNAQPGSPIRLKGSTNRVPWTVETWGVTDSVGSFGEKGTFASSAPGDYTLNVEVAGTQSNVVSFSVANCAP